MSFFFSGGGFCSKSTLPLHAELSHHSWFSKNLIQEHSVQHFRQHRRHLMMLTCIVTHRASVTNTGGVVTSHNGGMRGRLLWKLPICGGCAG